MTGDLRKDGAAPAPEGAYLRPVGGKAEIRGHTPSHVQRINPMIAEDT